MAHPSYLSSLVVGCALFAACAGGGDDDEPATGGSNSGGAGGSRAGGGSGGTERGGSGGDSGGIDSEAGSGGIPSGGSGGVELRGGSGGTLTGGSGGTESRGGQPTEGGSGARGGMPTGGDGSAGDSPGGGGGAGGQGGEAGGNTGPICVERGGACDNDAHCPKGSYCIEFECRLGASVGQPCGAGCQLGLGCLYGVCTTRHTGICVSSAECLEGMVCTESDSPIDCGGLFGCDYCAGPGAPINGPGGRCLSRVSKTWTAARMGIAPHRMVSVSFAKPPAAAVSLHSNRTRAREGSTARPLQRSVSRHSSSGKTAVSAEQGKIRVYPEATAIR